MTSDICLATDGFAAYSSRDIRFCPFRATSHRTHKPRVSLRSALGYALVALSGRAGHNDVGVSDTVGRLPNALSRRNGNNAVGVSDTVGSLPNALSGRAALDAIGACDALGCALNPIISQWKNHSHPDQ